MQNDGNGDIEVSRSSPQGQRIIPLLVILTLCYAVAFLGMQGAMQGFQGYYPSLAKPAWNPPPWVFGAVWTVLYGTMGVAAWQVWKAESVRRSLGLTLFGLQLALNGLWSWLFFAWEKPFLSFAEICVLDLAVLFTLLVFLKIRRSAGWLLAPYLVWILFATVLNFSIWRMNPEAGVTRGESPAVEFGG